AFFFPRRLTRSSHGGRFQTITVPDESLETARVPLLSRRIFSTEFACPRSSFTGRSCPPAVSHGDGNAHTRTTPFPSPVIARFPSADTAAQSRNAPAGLAPRPTS